MNRTVEGAGWSDGWGNTNMVDIVNIRGPCDDERFYMSWQVKIPRLAQTKKGQIFAIYKKKQRICANFIEWG